MDLKEADIEKAITTLKDSGAKPPYRMWVSAPYENPYGLWRIGPCVIEGHTVKQLLRSYTRLWKRWR